MEFPISTDVLLTVAGAATFSGLVSMWLKHYLNDWRYTNILVLSLSMLVSLVAQLIASAGHNSVNAVFVALLIGFVGATVATFGYETASNLAGLVGVGNRSDRALVERAVATVSKSGGC